MATTTFAQPSEPPRVALELIDVGENMRELDEDHVNDLAASIKLRGLVVPVTLRPVGARFQLVAGRHRLAACRKLSWPEIPVTIREQRRHQRRCGRGEHPAAPADAAGGGPGRQGDARRRLHTRRRRDGARVEPPARRRPSEDPRAARGPQQLLDTGALPVGAVDTLLAIAAVSRELCAGVVQAVAAGDAAGSQLARDPGWALGQALRGGHCKAFAAYLNTVSGYDVAELRLGKKAEAAYREAEQLHKQLDRYAYGPPTVRFEEADVDQARAAGVLIEFDRGAPIITDRALYRELVKQAIPRTVEALRTSRDAHAADKAATRKAQRERTRVSSWMPSTAPTCAS